MGRAVPPATRTLDLGVLTGPTSRFVVRSWKTNVRRSRTTLLLRTGYEGATTVRCPRLALTMPSAFRTATARLAVPAETP